jgi:hypothetical protein
MLPRIYCFLSCNLLMAAVFCLSPATGGEVPTPPANPHHKVAPAPRDSVSRYAAVPPGHQRYYVYNVEQYPWFNHGCAVPTYDWGYFGARTRPILSAEHRYRDGIWQLSFQPSD